MPSPEQRPEATANVILCTSKLRLGETEPKPRPADTFVPAGRLLANSKPGVSQARTLPRDPLI